LDVKSITSSNLSAKGKSRSGAGTMNNTKYSTKTKNEETEKNKLISSKLQEVIQFGPGESAEDPEATLGSIFYGEGRKFDLNE
jgi:hypothetical protein